MNLRKWSIPLALVGLGSLGAMLLTERGRKLLQSAVKPLRSIPGRLEAWDDSAQQELDHIQQEVKDIEQSLGSYTAH